MPLSGLTDEIEFKVFRSHVKIPMIFLVPVAFLVTLYAGLYLYANSAGFITQLTRVLHAQMGGHFSVRALKVDATLTRVHLFEATVATPEHQPAIEAREVRASLNPLVLLAGRLSVGEAVVRGAHVRTEFDDQGRLGLLRALGIGGGDDEPETPKKDGGLSIEFADIEVIDSQYSFRREGLEFHIPSVNVPQASIAIEPQTILMRVDHLDVPHIDFRFDNEFIRMPPEAGDWVFGVDDVEIRNWRWANDGFGVESVAFWSEGVQVQARGQMNFPSGDGPDVPTMTYDGTGTVSVEQWSPLAQYFIDDAVHFTVPEFNISARGSLSQIDGAAEFYASYIEAAGLRFQEVRGTLTLSDEWIDLRDVSADVHGGTLEVSDAYVNIFEVMYGARGRFQGVNPRSLLQDFEVDLPFLDGRGSGGFEVHGAVPFFPKSPSPTDPYGLRDFATRKLAEVTITRDWVLRRNNRLLVPAARAVLKKGTSTWVDFDRVVIPSARLLLDDEPVRIEDFRFAYPTMTFEDGPDGRPIRITADIRDVGTWTSLYGLNGVSGPIGMQFDFSGPLASPQAVLDIRNGRAPIQFPGTAIASDDLRLRVGLKKGRLTLHDAAVETRLGHASMSGWVDLLEAAPARRVRDPDAPTFAIRRHQPADLAFKASQVNLGSLNQMLDFGELAGLGAVPLEGMLAAQGTLKGSLQDPEVSLDSTIRRGNLLGQPVPKVHLKAGMKTLDGGARAVVVEDFALDAADAGSFKARGHYGFDGSYAFDLKGDGTRFGRIVPIEQLPEDLRPKGNMTLAVHGEGTLNEPNFGGHIQVRELGVGARNFGDLFLALNTVEDAVYLVGAALPLSTLQVRIPLKAGAPYYVRLGMEKLDLSAAIAELRGSKAVADSSVTGMVELFIPQDLSSWRVRTYLTELEFETLGRGIKNRGPLVLEVVDGKSVTIENATIGAGDRYVTATGSILLDPMVFDVALDGQLDLSILNPLRTALPQVFPAALISSRGALDLDARLAGPLKALRADGTIAFHGAQFMLRGLMDPVEVTRGTVHLGGNRIFVPAEDPISGTAMGGVYNLVGELALHRDRPPTLQAHAWSHNMKVRAPETANVTFDTDLRLDAADLQRPETWLVSGDVDVLDGIFYRDSSLIESQVTGRVFGAFDRRNQRYEASIFDQVPMLSKIRFNVALRARDGFKIENQIDRLALNLELRVDLRLRDTLVDPFVSGDVDVISGVVGFQGEKFNVRSGTVRFAGELGKPWIDVTAGADIRNRCREDQFRDEFQTDMTLSGDLDATRERYYHVMLHLIGYADNLDIQFDSNPYADQRDILSLLLTGCTVDQLTASSASGPTLEIALGPLLGRIEKEIQDVVKVNEFTIMPGVERTQVRIGDRLSRRLSWNFQLDTGMNQASGGQRYQLEYKLSDRWAVELSERSHSESNNFLLDLKLKYSLPLK